MVHITRITVVNFQRFWIRWLVAIAILLATLVVYPLPSKAETALDGAKLFTVHCAGCHPGGGNIIRRGKTLKLRDLKRQHVDSVEAIATIVTNGKGLMSAYADKLTLREISTIADYIWLQAQQNWPRQ